MGKEEETSFNMENENTTLTLSRRPEEEAVLSRHLEIEEESLQENHAYKLNKKQKWQVIGAVLSSFLLFALFFFPYQAVLHDYFSSFAKAASLRFTQTELNFFGDSSIENLSYSFGKDSGVEIRQVQFGISFLKLMRGLAEGPIEMTNFYLAASKLSLYSKNILVSTDLEKIDQPPLEWEGTLQIQTKGTKITVPFIQNMQEIQSLGIDLSRIKVQTLDVKLSFEQPKLKFDGSKLVSNYFTIKMTGSAQLAGNLEKSRLSGKLCAAPAADLEEKDSSLMGAYILAGGTAGGKLCWKVGGTVENPSFTISGARSPVPSSPIRENPAPIKRYDKNPSPIRKYDTAPAPIRRYEKSPPPIKGYDKAPLPIRKYDKAPVPIRRYDEKAFKRPIGRPFE